MPRVLTDEQVRGILRDHEAGVPQIVIAAKHRVSRMSVYGIVSGRTHREVVAQFEADDDGTTDAELDALIAERYATMPSEARYEPQGDRLPQAVQRGVGLRVTKRRIGEF